MTINLYLIQMSLAVVLTFLVSLAFVSSIPLTFIDNVRFNALGNNSSKIITASNVNAFGTLIVCYSDGTAEEYTKELQFIRSIKNIRLGSPVIQINVFSYPNLSLTLNGNPFSSNNTIISVLDSNRLELKIIDYQSMAVLIDYYPIYLTYVVCYFLVPITTYKSTTDLQLITNYIILVVNSLTLNAYLYPDTQLNLITFTDRVKYGSIEPVTLLSTNNQITVSFRMVLGFTSTIFTLSGSLKLNLLSSGAALINAGSNMSFRKQSPSLFNFIFFQSLNSFGYFQDSQGNVIAIDIIRTADITQMDAMLTQSRMLQIFSYNGSTYILFVDRIMSIAYDSIAKSITTLSISMLPSSKNRRVVTQTAELFYYDDTATYRINYCLDLNCLACIKDPSVCEKCLYPFKLQNGNCRMTVFGSFTNYNGTIQSALVCGTGQSFQNDMCDSIANSSGLWGGVYVNKILLSVPIISKILIFARSFFEFTNDYWYYLYHNRNYSELVWSNLFFGIMTFMNNGKMVPGFINTDAINAAYDQKCGQIFTSDYSNYTNPNVLQIDGSPSYFIKIMRDVFLWKYSFIFIMFILSRIVVAIYVSRSRKIMFVLSKVNLKNQKRTVSSKKSQKFILPKKFQRTFCKQRMREAINFFKQNYLVKALLIQLIEDNLIFLTFYCGLQLRMNSFLNFYDKINLILTLKCLFLCIAFSFCFYFFIFSNYPQESANFIDNRCKKIEAYGIKTIQIVTKGAFYGFIQGYFLADYMLLMVLLILLKIVTIVIMFVQRALFKRKTLWFLYFSYLCFGLLYDIFLLITSLFDIFSLQATLLQILDLFELSLISGFVFSITLHMIVSIFYGLRAISHQISQRIKTILSQQEVKDIQAGERKEPVEIEEPTVIKPCAAQD